MSLYNIEKNGKISAGNLNSTSLVTGTKEQTKPARQGKRQEKGAKAFWFCTLSGTVFSPVFGTRGSCIFMLYWLLGTGHPALTTLTFQILQQQAYTQLGSEARAEVDLTASSCCFQKGGADWGFVKECTSENKSKDERGGRARLSLCPVPTFSSQMKDGYPTPGELKGRGEKAKPAWVPFPESLKDHEVRLGMDT